MTSTTRIAVVVSGLQPFARHGIDNLMTKDADSSLAPEKMIEPDDLFKTIQWLMSLSPGACVKEVVITNTKSL